MATYLPFLIKVGQPGAYSESMTYDPPFDTKSDFNLWIKSAPYVISPNIKNPTSQSWLDQDGDDVYLSPDGVKHSAYDFICSFVYDENDNLANENISAFIERIKGKWLKVYDSYTNTCRKGVYMVSADPPESFKRRGTRDLVIFKVKFKCNIPTFNEVF